MADIKDLIGAIVNKDALSVKEIFAEIIGEKIGERMEALRPLVADAMFNEGKMKCDECGYGMAKEDSNCKKCGCSMNEDYDWDSLVDEELNESDDNVKDDAPDTVAKDHPLVQLKKILDTKGGAFRTSTGKTVHVDHASAKRLLALHNATQKSEVKQKFASAVHRDPIGTHDLFFPKAKIGEESSLWSKPTPAPKHNSDHIFTYHGKGGYYGGSRTYVYANPKGDKHERFQVVHQGPDKGGEHGVPRMKVSYHPDVLSAQKHAEKLAGKGATQVREESELDNQDLDEVRWPDHAERRKRERDFDAGKPVKPLPKNPQNTYFARRKKEKERELSNGPRYDGNGFKEESELDELSRRTLGSYATKAMNRGDIAVRMSKSDDDGMGKIANKRFAGVKLAARKIATSAGAGRATATAVAKNVDAAKAAGQGASSGSNKDREDYGKSYNAAQRNITKLRNMGEESELDESMAGYTATSEPTKGGHSAVVKDSKGQTRYAGGSVYPSAEHAVKGAQAYINARGGEYGSDMERSYHKHVTLMAKEESELNELDKPSDGKDTILSRYIEKNKAQKFRNRGQSFERGMGLDTATDKVKGTARVPAVTREESELDEISKGLVTNYFHAAEKDSESRGKRIDRLNSIPVKTKKDQEGLTTLRKGLQKIQNKRTRGMGMAMNKYSGNAKVNATEETELDEGGMPSGVASHKTMLRNMSDADFAASPHYGKMSDDTLRSMAWSHGYGKPGTPGHNHYVNKKKDGLRALAAAEKKD